MVLLANVLAVFLVMGVLSQSRVEQDAKPTAVRADEVTANLPLPKVKRALKGAECVPLGGLPAPTKGMKTKGSSAAPVSWTLCDLASVLHISDDFTLALPVVLLFGCSLGGTLYLGGSFGCTFAGPFWNAFGLSFGCPLLVGRALGWPLFVGCSLHRQRKRHGQDDVSQPVCGQGVSSLDVTLLSRSSR